MSDNDFNIYLVSNVTTEIFSDNSPAKFSTILAEDIHLPNGEWEVAVKNIVYPSHIQSTTEEDKIEIYKYRDEYRHLYPQRAREDYREDDSNIYTYTVPIATTADKGSNLCETIVNTINADLKSKQLDNIMKFEAKVKSKKMVLHIFQKDFFVVLHPKLHKYLGFKSNQSFMRGSHWSWHVFNCAEKPPDQADRLIFMSDLQSQNQEQYTLKKILVPVRIEKKVKKKEDKKEKGGKKEDKKEKGEKKEDENEEETFRNEVIYRASVELKFKENKADDLFSKPNMYITVRPEKGTIELYRSDWDIPTEIREYEKHIRMIKFDDTMTEALKLKPIYYLTDASKNLINFTFQKVEHETALKKLANNTCTVYFEGVRELERDPTNTPIDVITVNAKETFKRPSDFVPHLNTFIARKHDVKFTFNENEQRFYLKCGRNTFVQLSKSLATILGFSNLQTFKASPSTVHRANDFPVLDRAITSLYVYSNIVESVFIGNVKASLLLTCPFQKNSANNVSQLEFLNPTYTKLNRSTIHQIDIAIHDEAGALIPFLYGKTVLTLTFRKCNV